LVGLEYNGRAAQALREESRGWPEIRALQGDALALPFGDGAFDYVFCSLLTHHFREEQGAAILREMRRVARRRVVVLDLHRHPVAYYFYTTAGRLFLRNRLVRSDGALSILRSFTPAELQRVAAQAGWPDSRIERHFPYRLVLSSQLSAG
jgi:ubiquinone/menaquinone biosynthesis C-methylase UbiE